MKQLKLMFILASIGVSFFAQTGRSGVNVLTYHNDAGRTGQNLNETILAPANLKTNTFGKLFSYSVDGYVFAQPLIVSGLNIPGQGTHNVLFIATEHNSVYAFDADRNSGPYSGLLWQVNLGTSAATPNSDFGTRYNSGRYLDITPEVGITGTPVIDLNSGTLYVDAFTHEGSSYFHRLHALNITNGAERANSPMLVAASVPGAGVGGNGTVVPFVAKQELQRGALTLAGGMVYIIYTAYADTDPYHGWILGFDATSLQLLSLFITTPNATTGTFGVNAGEGGIWMGGNGIAVDADTNLYVEVGNGSFNALNGSSGTEFADSFLKFSASAGSLVMTDYFTPFDQASMASSDQDLGSGGMILIPDQPGPYPHLMAGAGKGGKIYLVNRDQMTSDNGHYNSNTSVDHIVQTVSGQIGSSFDTPAYFNGQIYYAGNGSQLKSFTLSPTSGLLTTTPVSTGPRTYAFPGATPVVSANGTNNGIVWALANASPAVLAAHNAASLSPEIYNSTTAPGNRDRLANGVKFALPIVANGKVFVGNQYSVSVFGLLDPYLNWKYAHFGSDATNAAVSGDLLDPDADGAVNLLEFALATDPNVVNTNSSISGAISGNQFQVNFNRNTTATNVTYVVQSSDSLNGPWSDLITYTTAGGWTANVVGATALESAPLNTPPDQYVMVTVTDPADVTVLSSGGRCYRLWVHP